MKISGNFALGFFAFAMVVLVIVFASVSAGTKPQKIDVAKDKVVALAFIAEIRAVHEPADEIFIKANEIAASYPLRGKEAYTQIIPVMQKAVYALDAIQYPDLTDKESFRVLTDALLDMRIAYAARLQGLKDAIDGKNSSALEEFEKGARRVRAGVQKLNTMQGAYE